MNPRDAVFERFERYVELPSYLARAGYQADASASGPEGIKMANATTGDVVMVRKSPETDRWTYASVRDPLDRGGVSDFAMRREGLTHAQWSDRLVALANPLSRDPAALRYRAALTDGPAELKTCVANHLRGVGQAKETALALESLGIPRGTLDEWRFGPIDTPTALSNALSDPSKLWASRYRPTDRAVVITEQPIDALAYERIRGRQTACYLCTGRQPSPETTKTLAHLLCEIPRDAQVVLAFGGDERGRRLAAQVRALAPTIKMERQEPEFGGRWSHRLQLERNHRQAMGRAVASLGR